jgi:hypothetical protein
MVTWLCGFGLVTAQCIMGEASGEAELLTSSQPGSKVRDRKGVGSQYAL